MWRKRPAAAPGDDGMPELPGLPPRSVTHRQATTVFIARATDGHPREQLAPAGAHEQRGGLQDACVQTAHAQADGAHGHCTHVAGEDGQIPSDGGSDASGQGSRRPTRAPPTPTARALGLLARREHSRRELRDKLVARGVEAAAAETAIQQLGQAGWQSDLRYAESLFRQRRSTGYGPRYIAAELQARGVASAVIAQAMGGDDGRDWVGIATELLQRRLGDAAITAPHAELRQRALALLLRRGFDTAQAREAFERLRRERGRAGCLVEGDDVA